MAWADGGGCGISAAHLRAGFIPNLGGGCGGDDASEGEGRWGESIERVVGRESAATRCLRRFG